MQKLTQTLVRMLSSFQDLALLMVRLMLAYGFFNPAMKKINNFDNIVKWFDTGLDLPFPWLMALLATITEALIVVFMVLGFKARLIAVPGMVTMLVAIFLVHWDAGFKASNNGYEIALYYFLFLFIIATTGPGKYAIDKE